MQSPEKHILLVEDEATTREIITYALRGEGYGVDSVANASAATICLNSVRYALVIADWLLPDGNGLDIADTALEAGTKTLIISGVVSALAAGIDRHEFLSKPVGPLDILSAVRRAIGSPTGEP